MTAEARPLIQALSVYLCPIDRDGGRAAHAARGDADAPHAGRAGEPYAAAAPAGAVLQEPHGRDDGQPGAGPAGEYALPQAPVNPTALRADLVVATLGRRNYADAAPEALFPKLLEQAGPALEGLTEVATSSID